jgi:hypothetical protein
MLHRYARSAAIAVLGARMTVAKLVTETTARICEDGLGPNYAKKMGAVGTSTGPGRTWEFLRASLRAEALNPGSNPPQASIPGNCPVIAIFN